MTSASSHQMKESLLVKAFKKNFKIKRSANLKVMQNINIYLMEEDKMM